MTEINELQKEIADWADMVFPDRTAWDAAVKLMMEEIPEWLSNMEDPLEYADLVILIFDIAYLNNINIAEAIREKMGINKRRNWVYDPETRTIHHTK